MLVTELNINGKYNFIGQEDLLIYIGHNWSGNGYWHQFEKVGTPDVWCELQTNELNLLEETK